MSDENRDEFGFVGTYDVNTYELKSLYELDAPVVKNNESRLHEKANQYNGWVFGGYR